MKSYFRFLERNKAYTAVQFIGLAVSLGFVIIVFAYLVQEIGKKYEFPYEDTYAVGSNETLGMSYGTKDALDAAIPEISLSSKFILSNEYTVTAGQRDFRVDVHSVDKEFFGIFPLDFLSGDENVLDDYSNVLISSRFASEAFPDGNVQGRNIFLNGETFTVAGVFDMDGDRGVLPYADIMLNIGHPVLYADFINMPNNVFGPILVAVRLAKGTSQEDFKAKVTDVYKDTFGEDFGLFFTSAETVRFDRLYFYESSGNYCRGNKNMLLLLSLAGAALLISAVFNYVNLNTVLSGKRAKEMAVREIYGMGRHGICRTWISESLLFTSMCFVAGILIALVAAPYLGELSGIDIELSRSLTPAGLLGYAAIVVIVSCMSGWIPAFFLSRTPAVEITKGEFRFKNKMVFSKLLIILQNVISIVLICLSITMSRQMRYMMEMPVGADTEDLYYFAYYGEDALEQTLYDGFKALPCVEDVGHSAGFPAFVASGQYGTTVDGKNLLYRNLRMDTTAFRMLGFNILKEFSAVSDRSVWFTETAMRAAGLDENSPDISLTRLDAKGGFRDICGVISDFAIHDASHVGADDFGIILIDRPENLRKLWGASFVIKTLSDHAVSEKMIGDFWKKTLADAGLPDFTEADYSFYIDDYLSLCLDDARDNGKLVTMFMVLAVMISMLGMVSISAYFISERARDISLRRIFGAMTADEMWRNMKSFLLVVLIADAVAVPLAWWLCRRYLEEFYYRLIPVPGYSWRQ